MIDVDTVIYALGTTANPIIAQTTPGLSTNKWGYIEIDEQTGMTRFPACSRAAISSPAPLPSFWRWAREGAPPRECCNTWELTRCRRSVSEVPQCR